jgi:prepilin-type processing-associated H-X9-DG protein
MYDKVKNNYKSNINYYAFNTWTEKKSIVKFPDPTAVFLTCDSDAVNNLWYSPADTANRHSGQCIYSYVDGHVSVAKDDLSKSYMIIINGNETNRNDNYYYRPYIFNKILNFPNTDPALNNLDFTSTDLDCGLGSAWKQGPVNMFTITWDGYIQAPATGIYKFNCITDDNVTLELIDFKPYKTTTVLKSTRKGNIEGQIKLTANKYYEFKLTFIESNGSASMAIRWTPPNGKPSRIPSSIFRKGIEALTSN